MNAAQRKINEARTTTNLHRAAYLKARTHEIADKNQDEQVIRIAAECHDLLRQAVQAIEENQKSRKGDQLTSWYDVGSLLETAEKVRRIKDSVVHD